jgi:CheY-like chemotaxis protein
MPVPVTQSWPTQADQGPQVLIVEDDVGIATQLVRGLVRGGYQVDHVTTGRDALAHDVPDVVLLDLELPDGDGVNVCRKLRERHDVAIIVITAYGEEPDPVPDRVLVVTPVFRDESAATIGAVALSRSTEPLDNRIRALWTWLALTSAIGLLAAALAATALARWVGGPLSGLDAAARRLGAGEFRRQVASGDRT